MNRLQVGFKSLEHSVPYVVVEAPQSLKYAPILDYRTPVKNYVEGRAYISIHVRAEVVFNQGHRSCAWLKALGANEVPIAAATTSSNLRTTDQRQNQYLSVLIPVVHFVEQPEGILIQRLPSRVWGQGTSVLLGRWSKELDARIGKLDRDVIDGELGNLLILGLHRRVLLREGEDEVVETTPKTLERIPKDKTDFVWKRLELFCEQYESPIGLGLLEDSIAIVRPFRDPCLKVLDVRLSADELVSVTRHEDLPLMLPDKEPKERTAKGREISVPTRGEFFRDITKVAKASIRSEAIKRPESDPESA